MLRARRDFALVVEGVALSRRDQLLPDNIVNGVCVCVSLYEVDAETLRCAATLSGAKQKGARWDI
jgi:hypothetical protein